MADSVISAPCRRRPKLPPRVAIALSRTRTTRSLPMTDTITVANRYCGPPESGNGGYVCGLLARHVHGDAEVTLRLPPPLERALTVRAAPGHAELYDGDAVVAEAVAMTTPLEVTVPAPV